MAAAPRNFHFHDLCPPPADFRSAVIEGFSGAPRRISPKFFYDARGSQLFDAITRLPEYYPTRTEIGLLREHGAAIAGLLGEESLLIELGSGSDAKIRVLLDALRPRAYLPIDISREHLWRATSAIAEDHPTLDVYALCTDYTRPFAIPWPVRELQRAAFFPGSSIGNFEPEQAQRLLQAIATMLGVGGRLLVGVDLKKDPARLHAAYNDAQGVTACFNLNVLERMRRELAADVDPAGFRHHAFYDPVAGRIEMHLVAMHDQVVAVDGHRFSFAEGDGIHTENSYKYSVAEFTALALTAGFESLHVWQDDDALFSVHCLEVATIIPE